MATNNSIDRPAATQTDQENFVSTTVYVQPGVQQYHPGHPKAWASFNGTGTPALLNSYNITSITDNGVGSWALNFTVGFSTSAFGAVTCGDNSAANSSTVLLSKASGSVSIRGVNFVTNTNVDLTDIGVICAGDQ